MTVQSKTPTMERLTGVVESVNEKGVKIDGEWHNFSRYAKEGAIEPVEPKATVECHLDGAGFVRTLVITESGLASAVEDADADSDEMDSADAAIAEVASVSLKESVTMKDALILRQTCIKAAAEFAANRPDIKSTDVLKIAECWERWIVR